MKSGNIHAWLVMAGFWGMMAACEENRAPRQEMADQFFIIQILENDECHPPYAINFSYPETGQQELVFYTHPWLWETDPVPVYGSPLSSVRAHGKNCRIYVTPRFRGDPDFPPHLGIWALQLLNDKIGSSGVDPGFSDVWRLSAIPACAGVLQNPKDESAHEACGKAIEMLPVNIRIYLRTQEELCNQLGIPYTDLSDMLFEGTCSL